MDTRDIPQEPSEAEVAASMAVEAEVAASMAVEAEVASTAVAVEAAAPMEAVAVTANHSGTHSMAGNPSIARQIFVSTSGLLQSLLAGIRFIAGWNRGTHPAVF
jgi:hypothetical protein